MVSSPKDLGLDQLILEDPRLCYETIVRAIFRNVHVTFFKDVVWLEYWGSISDDNKRKLEKICHFYYYMCLPFEESFIVPDAKRLVFTASILESLMSDVEFKDFYQFLKMKKVVNERNLKELHEEYLDQFGCNRKFRSYFETYFVEKDLRWLCCVIRRFRNGEFRSLGTVSELSTFFYSLRSEVVHSANIRIISNELLGSIELKLQGKHYKIDLDIYEYLKSFERSLVKFFDVNRMF